MGQPKLHSVNVGRPQAASWVDVGRSSIRKTALGEPVWAGRLGLEGDEVSDTRHHGGTHQAVYAFAREDLDAWGERLGGTLPDGMFGENLTTSGIDVNEAIVGESWRIGDAVLRVVDVRIPCQTFKGRIGEAGHDDRGWVRRFTEEARPGPYLRVLEEGAIQVGDAIVVEDRPGHGVTVTTMFRALTTSAELLPRLLEIEDLHPKLRARAEKYAAETERDPRTGVS